MSKKALASILPQHVGHQYPEGVRTLHSIAADYTAADKYGVWLKSQADKTQFGNQINPNAPWEKSFQTVVRNQLNKSSSHRDNPALVEEVADSILPKINSEFLGRFDPKRGLTINQYILRFVQLRTIDYLRYDHGVNKRQGPTTDGEGQTLDPLDQLSNEDVQDPEDQPGFQMEYNDLIRSIREYLGTTNRAEWYTRIFNEIIQGHTRQDIQAKFNVSAAIITRYIAGLEDELKKYAAKTDNELLAQLLSGGTGRRKKSSDTSYIVAVELEQVFQQYKQITNGEHHAAQEGAVQQPLKQKPDAEGRVTQHVIHPVRVEHTKNLLSRDAISSFIQDQYLGDSQVTAQTGEFIQKINTAADIIEGDDGDLTFLFK